MSILIKGMEKPESCYYCPFASGSWGQNLEKWCDVLGKQIPDNGTLMNWCPLVYVTTEDVKPVIRGEWIKMDKRGNNVQCSECGNTLDLRGVNAGRGDANYCPNCGADMRPRLQGTEIDGMYIDISGDGTVVEQI